MITDAKRELVLKAMEREGGGFKSAEEGIKYLCSLKHDLLLTWDDVADLSKEFFNTPWKEGFFRKRYGEYVQTAEQVSQIDQKILELRKERIKLSDERVQNNAYIRRMAREDTIKEIALQAAAEIGKHRGVLPHSCHLVWNEGAINEAILCLSDWHLGIDINNPFNLYNPDIAQARVAKLLDEVIERLVVQKDIAKLHVVNLGDMIAGRIHLTIRLQSRIDVITQTIQVSEMLADLLARLSMYVPIEYYSCSDNHSRVEPCKEDSLDLESLCRIIDWYLAERLRDNANIHFNTNQYGDDIVAFDCCGHRVVGVHGDKDKKTQLERLQLMLREPIDMLLIAHLHHPWMEETDNVRIIGNGSLMGLDDYAKNLRLSSHASQTLIVASPENSCKEVRIIDVQNAAEQYID